MRRLLQLLFMICLVSSTTDAATTKATLRLATETASPGSTILAGVELQMKDGWHTYWRNPGESGGTTEIKWELPSGITAGAVQWPVPEKYLFLDSFNYVYHGQVILVVPFTIAPDVKPGEYQISGKASWIECEQVCIPGRSPLSATLTVAAGASSPAAPDWLEQAKSKLPQSGKDLKATVRWDKDEAENLRSIIIEWNPARPSPNPDFYPDDIAGMDILPKTEVLKNEGGTIQIRKSIKKFKGEWPDKIAGVLVEDSSKGQDATAYEVELPFGKSSAVASGSATHGGKLAPEEKESLIKMLFLAFLGGLLLNIMPCVLPVIALKILGFVQQSHEEPARVKKLGLVYTTGVLFSFVIFAGFVIAVKAAGSTASWGMHMQNPYFRMLMTTLMFLVALNLFGIFEVTLGGKTVGAAANLSSRSGSLGTFFNGMLAVALGASCTAPLLASAIGYAIPLSYGTILLFFLTIGFGMAFPYLVLSWQPNWIKFLPKPGAWMEKFKIAMGFPVLATALWLFSFTARSFGKESVWGFGLFLLTLAVAVWIWGEFIQRGRSRKGLAFAFMLGFLAFGYWYGLEDRMEWRTPHKGNAGSSNVISSKGIDWHPWSREAIAKFRAEGHPVLVDFTADWCPNCKSNKRRAIDIDPVRAALKRTGTITMVADFTDESPEIAKELEKFKRSAVPLVLVYPRNPTEDPIVLPPTLTEGIVLEALDKAAK